MLRKLALAFTFTFFLAAPSAHATAETITAIPSAVSSNASNAGGIEWRSSASTTSLAEASRGVGGGYAYGLLKKDVNDGSASLLSQYLSASDFRFSIPTNAIIRGITVTIGKRGGTAGRIRDVEVRLVVRGVATSLNEARPTLWADTFASAVYGGPNDVWGRSWTAADIDDPSFGIVFSAINTDMTGGHEARVNSISVAVTYSVPTPIPASRDYMISLQKGWNLISAPITPENELISETFTDPNIDSVWSYDPSNPEADSGWLVYEPKHPEYSNLESVLPGYGYFIHASSTGSLSFSGSLFAPGTAPPSRSLVPGWNLVGAYVPDTDDVDNAFATIGWAGIEYTSLWKLNPYMQTFGLPSIVNPGDAFWILTDAPHIYAPADL